MKAIYYFNILLPLVFFHTTTAIVAETLKPLYFNFEILKGKSKASLPNILYPTTLLTREENKYYEYISGGELTLLTYTENKFAIKNVKNDTHLKVKVKKLPIHDNDKFHIEYAIIVNLPLQENFISFCGSETILLDKPYIIHTTISEKNEKVSTLPYLLIFSLKKASEKEYWGNIAGIGIKFIKDKEGLVTITDVYPGTPAEKIGIKNGDKIIEINGNFVVPMSIEEVKESLLGSVGSKVKLKLLDENRREKLLEVERKIWRFMGNEN